MNSSTHRKQLLLGAWRQVAWLVGLIVILASVPARGQEAGPVLSPGDRVEITIFGHDDLSGEFEVDAMGRLSLPLIKDITAQGLTLDQLEDVIADALQPDFLRNPRVTAQLLSMRPFYILGEVNNPGSYPCTADMTLMRAVATAGGFTHRARTKRIVIRRVVNGEETEIPASEGMAIQPGDLIQVPERFF